MDQINSYEGGITYAAPEAQDLFGKKHYEKTLTIVFYTGGEGFTPGIISSDCKCFWLRTVTFDQ